MRRMVGCGSCSRCAAGYGLGFTGAPVMVCSRDDAEVSPDDGCTLGERGEPMSLSRGVCVEVGGFAAVNGTEDWE